MITRDRESLIDYILASPIGRFEWGENDCCLFSANVVREFTGRDYAAGYRGKYSTELGAARYLLRHGGIESLLDHELGIRKPINNAQLGDVVTFGEKSRIAAGVCLGFRSVFIMEQGVYFPVSNECRSAWGV